MVHNIFDLLYMCTIYYLETCLIIDIYIYIYRYIYIYIYRYIYIYIYIYRYIYIYTYLYIYIDTYLYIYTDTNTHTHIYIYIYIYIYALMFVCRGNNVFSLSYAYDNHIIIFFTCFFLLKHPRRHRKAAAKCPRCNQFHFNMCLRPWYRRLSRPTTKYMYLYFCVYLSICVYI